MLLGLFTAFIVQSKNAQCTFSHSVQSLNSICNWLFIKRTGDCE